MNYSDIAHAKAHRFAEFMRAREAWTRIGSPVPYRLTSHGQPTRFSPFMWWARVKAKRFAIKLCDREIESMADPNAVAALNAHRARLKSEIAVLTDQLQMEK